MKLNFAAWFAALSLLKSVYGIGNGDGDVADCDGYPGQSFTVNQSSNEKGEIKVFSFHHLPYLHVHNPSPTKQTRISVTFTALPLISKADVMSSW